MTKARSEKVLVLGVDGMDPRITRRMIDEGKLPHLKALKEQGAMRDDLVLLGAMPTITPPQWTTLSTGSYPETHGITCFYAQHPTELDKITYNLHSASCRSEQLWNVTAEAGKKTLVFHWPGCSWPPTSDSANLHVIDGVTPASINMGLTKDTEKILYASPEIKELIYRSRVTGATGAGCILDDLQTDGEEAVMSAVGDIQNVMLSYDDGEGSLEQVTFDVINSPVTEPKGWTKDIADGAKEFGYITSQGLIRRYCLLVKNEAGQYDHIAIYKSKKDKQPMVTIQNGEYLRDFVDEGIKRDDPIACNRDMRVLEINPDGSRVKMWVSASMEIAMDKMWHPQSLHQEILDNIGFPPPTSTLGGGDKQLISDCMHACWEHTLDWQSACLNYLIEAHDYDVIFSHFHSPDLQKHMFIREMKNGRPNLPPAEYEKFMQDVYTQIDRYVGRFMHLLDKGWTLIITSDHAQVCPT